MANWQRRLEQFEKWRGAVYWFSVIFLGTGCVLIGFSTWAFLANPLNVLASILPASFIVIGVFIFVVSFLGWYSSTRESARLMCLYIFFLCVSISVVFALTVITFRSDERQINTNLYRSWQDEYLIDNNATSSLFDIESTYYCCGFYNTSDYPVPSNCVDLLARDRPDQHPPEKGCQQDLYDVNREALNDVRITGLAASFVQLLGLVFAGLAMHYAPTQRDQEEMLDEETERLNEQWSANTR